MATWPATLPQSFEAKSWNTQPNTGVISTNMDAGPVKTRQRFTAVSNFHTGDMIMTKTLYDGDFLTFFNTTIAQGSIEFDFPDPLGGGTIVVRWVTGDRPYRVRQFSPTDIRISFALEQVP